ncbi:MAG: N-acetyltransferase [Eggerthellaceae bacterium]|nr:N-acetyltransferase [Eggerthellaceae bacterium]
MRPGRADDVPALLDIYNYEIINSVSPLHLEPRTPEMWQQWFDDHQNTLHPLLVADAGGRVAGYACLSVFRPAGAYRTTAELSIYVQRDFRGRGVATRLMGGIIDLARDTGELHALVSHVTADNEPSQRLHEKFGFRRCGTLREAGLKFGRYHDVHVYQLLLEEGR